MPRSFNILRKLVASDPFLKDDIASLLNHLGHNYFNGEDGSENNITYAIECFQEAANLGDKYANNNLVVCAKRLITENDIRDIEKAIRILRQHATIDRFSWSARGETVYDRSNIANYLNDVGAAFFNGTQGLEKNIQYAVSFFEEAAHLGDSRARSNLYVYAKSLIIGKEVSRDIQKSLSIFRKYCSGRSDKLEAYSFLRQCAIAFANGQQGFEKNPEMANDLLKEASNFLQAAGVNGRFGF